MFNPPNEKGGGIPQISLTTITGRFNVGGIGIQPVPIFHGSRPILGFRFGSFAYLTDCNRLPDEAWPLLEGVDVLILDALRHRPHPTHFTVAEALQVVERVKPRQTYFTHVCHDLAHAATNASLPRGVELAYDGLALTIETASAFAEASTSAKATVDKPEEQVDVIHFPDDPRPATWRSPVLALGNFDGLHRGHVKIIERIQRGAGERGGTSVVLTFDPHPPRILRPDKAPSLLMTKAQKLDALARAGVQGAAVVRFTREMSQWEPEKFVRTVLVEWLRVAEVWVGADFLFGRDRSGNFTVLRSLGATYGFRAEKIDPIRYKDFVVSSTRIRRLVAEGRVDEAGALLGHHYAIDGTVVEGAKRGREIGFPTANLSTDNELIPPHGVYATAVTIDGQLLPSVTNIGQRPTFGDQLATTIETHVIPFDSQRGGNATAPLAQGSAPLDLYGRTLHLAFVQRLRDERKFPDVEALQEQIAADVRRATRLFDRLSV